MRWVINSFKASPRRCTRFTLIAVQSGQTNSRDPFFAASLAAPTRVFSALFSAAAGARIRLLRSWITLWPRFKCKSGAQTENNFAINSHARSLRCAVVERWKILTQASSRTRNGNEYWRNKTLFGLFSNYWFCCQRHARSGDFAPFVNTRQKKRCFWSLLAWAIAIVCKY